jgi:hypothetical protein
MPVWCVAIAFLSPGQEKAPSETVIRMTVDPMPAPKPALRYLLLPELKEMTPGNPIPNYLKALLDQDHTQLQEDFPPAALRQADRAARMDRPDWQILTRLRIDGIALLLPDLQKMRELARSLQKRFHHEVSLRQFDDALVTAKTMFAMARHMGDHPTLIGALVGIAIAATGISPLEEMLQQPGCPNLYWALTQLPSPLVPMEKAAEGERIFLDVELRELSDREPMSPEQSRKLIAYIARILEFDPDSEEGIRQWIQKRKGDAKYMAAARKRLIEWGIPAERLARFPAEQVLLLDEKLLYEIDRDDGFKYWNLPTWKALDAMNKVPPPPKDRLFRGLLSALNKVRTAQGRLEQRIALLRHVEALRMYAADHGGKLPATLDEIDLPLPVDPFTGKPFRYELKDDTAHLRGTPPKGYEDVSVYNLHYEITIRK